MSSKNIREIVATGFARGASDIHLTVGRPPIYRLNGKLQPLPETLPLMDVDLKIMSRELLNNANIADSWQVNGQVDFACCFSKIGRVRVNLFRQRGFYALALRLIPNTIPQLETLGLPAIIKSLAMKDKGLILVTGATGSGKSTTLAGMINQINQTKNCHILTLEDPIEYLHPPGKCIINQREVGTDTSTFAHGLKAALRQNADVIMVGEMRDEETVSTAITAAETGHLVLTSLHSNGAAQTVERLISIFPSHHQAQIRIQLATTLQGIVSQQLVPRIDGNGRIAATEILIATPAIRNLLRENKMYQIYSAIQTGHAAGMITMDKSLKLLYQQNIISSEEYTGRIVGS